MHRATCWPEETLKEQPQPLCCTCRKAQHSPPCLHCAAQMRSNALAVVVQCGLSASQRLPAACVARTQQCYRSCTQARTEDRMTGETNTKQRLQVMYKLQSWPKADGRGRRAASEAQSAGTYGAGGSAADSAHSLRRRPRVWCSAAPPLGDEMVLPRRGLHCAAGRACRAARRDSEPAGMGSSCIRHRAPQRAAPQQSMATPHALGGVS